MKLSQAHVHPERETQTPDPQPPNPAKNSGAGEEASEIRNPQSESKIKNQRRGCAGSCWAACWSLCFWRASCLRALAERQRPPPYPQCMAWPSSRPPCPRVVPTAAPAATPQPTFGDAPPTLYINVPATNWEQITAARERALKRGILLAEDNPEVQGVLRYNNTDIPIKISLERRLGGSRARRQVVVTHQDGPKLYSVWLASLCHHEPAHAQLRERVGLSRQLDDETASWPRATGS